MTTLAYPITNIIIGSCTIVVGLIGIIPIIYIIYLLIGIGKHLNDNKNIPKKEYDPIMPYIPPGMNLVSNRFLMDRHINVTGNRYRFTNDIV